MSSLERAERRRKAQDGQNTRKILALIYPVVGRPAGVRYDKHDIPINPPFWQIGAVRPILDELYAIQGAQSLLAGETLDYFNQGLQVLAKEHPRLQITGIREGLPRALAKIGGFGPWKHKRIAKMSYLYLPQEKRVLVNDGQHCSLVVDGETIKCLIAQKCWVLTDIREASVEDIYHGLHVGACSDPIPPECGAPD